MYLHVRSREYLPERVWPTLRRQVERALSEWREPDHGIWEVRGAPRHFTSSKLFCWVAADRGARLAAMHDEPELAARWRDAANEIHADICAQALDERGVFVQHYETTALDAALLLMPLVRFLPASDSRIRATVLAIADELTVDGLVLRYRVEQTDDGLGTEEGTFTICSFWLVSALVEIGELDRARRLCEKLLSLGSPLQLFAEEVEPATGRHLGNFPQAFTHLALINAVMHVIRAQQQASARPHPAAIPDAGIWHERIRHPSGSPMLAARSPTHTSDTAVSGGASQATIPAFDARSSGSVPADRRPRRSCRTARRRVLIAPSGNVEWMCLPDPDSPSVFGTLLDRGAGRFRVGPSGVTVPAGQRYLLASMVIETTWMTPSGLLVVRDALALGPWEQERRSPRQHRPPGDTRAEHVLLRTVKCVHGSVEVAVDCEPMFDYGRLAACWSYRGLGYHAATATNPDTRPDVAT